jgi:alpha-amylase
MNIQNPISWADEERDITAWLGNELQTAALEKLYSLSRKVNRCEDDQLKKDWDYLQSSDHFYYMATKFFSDGTVHAYFNPYESPYDAFMNYMNVLSDFEIRLRRCFPDTAEQDQIFKLGNQVIEKDMLLEKQAGEIEKLRRKVARIRPAVKTAAKKVTKASELILEWDKSGKKPVVESKVPAKKKAVKVTEEKKDIKPVKTTKEKASSKKLTSTKKSAAAKKPVTKSKVAGQKKSK